MTATFDNAVEKLLEACMSHPDWANVERAVVVRDLRGRLRLVIKPVSGATAPMVGAALSASLGAWFAGPVLSTDSARPDEKRLASEILAQAVAWPPEWPAEWTDLAGTTEVVDPGRWRGLQRVLSKQSWFGPPTNPPRWPLVAGEPAVVSFYSFKGGVGRTTALALVAVNLALAGQKVVCVDLDLEAPGLGDFLGAQPTPALLDALLAHAATGQLPAEDPVQWVDCLGTQVGVVAAGGLGRGYLEKLARLDYLGTSSETDSPVARALHRLLERIRDQHRPNIILLDSRAGLHDLGGLSLTDLAHVDVLVGRDTPQNHAGLRLALEVIHRRRTATEQRLLIIQSFVPPPLDSEGAASTRRRMRAKMWAACRDSVYDGLDDADVPAEDARDEAHSPYPFAERNEISAAQHLGDIEPGAVGLGGLSEIVTRIQALVLPESP